MFIRLTRCRWKYKIYVLTFLLLIFFLCVYLNQQFGFFPIAPITVAPTSSGRITRHLSKLITVIFRQYDEFENDITDSVRSFASTFPNMPVFVVGDSTPYPPFPFSAPNETLKNVRVISLELRLNATPEELNILSHVNTDFVLLAPDGVRVSRRVLQHAISTAALSKNAIAIGITGSKIFCQFIDWRYADWTISYRKDTAAAICDAVHGPHALLIRTSLLRTLPEPFGMPLPEMLYLQTAVRDSKVQIFEGQFGVGHPVKTPASKKRVSKKLREHRTCHYRQLGIKALIRDKEGIHWYGCWKDTQRCFPPVQGTPSYILAGRNTPPCCLQNLRRTLQHVLATLVGSGGRCWLETTSLLGAVANGDLLPYAEYAEIGVHASDISNIPILSRGGVDSKGFVWERATKGRYYRVAYSENNRIYVIILPFVAKNGTMWPHDWVLAHQKEFPERHLHPLAQITIFGRPAPAPNDARAFLDLKLGLNALERSEWLGSKLLYP